MEITSPLAPFVLMPLFCLVAWGLSRLTDWTQHGPASATGYYAAVDGLRGVLAISVFFCHAVVTYFYLKTGVWELPSANLYGQFAIFPVTMFFFVTGFLFWTKLIRAEAGLPIRQFLMARTRRLMPAYLGSLAVVLILITAASGGRLHVPFSKLVPQLVSWLVCGVPFNFPRINALDSTRFINAGVFWSLRVEWFFYLLLPFLGWFAKRRRVWLLLLMCGALLEAMQHLARPANIMVVEPVLTLSFYMAFCFSVGMLTASLKAELDLARWLRSRWCAAPAFAILGVVLFSVPPRYGWLESLMLAPIFVIVVYGNDLCGLLTSRPIRYLGAISYSVYLFHGIVLYLVIQLAGRHFGVTSLSALAYWAVAAAAGVAVISVASISYRFLELPFLTSHPKVVAAPAGIPQLSANHQLAAIAANWEEGKQNG
jgi:peptidoglycan/LPS O-acetylase OafA/YrhL